MKWRKRGVTERHFDRGGIRCEVWQSINGTGWRCEIGYNGFSVASRGRFASEITAKRYAKRRIAEFIKAEIALMSKTLTEVES